MRLVALLLVIGCNSAPPKPDCEAYATHFAAAAAPNENKDVVHREALADCQKGTLDPKLVACVMKATTSDDLDACLGMKPAKPATRP